MKIRPHQQNQQGNKRTGAIMLEAAACFPLLIITFVGLADAGRMAYTRIAVSNACRTGIDYAATHRDSPLFQPQWQMKIREAVLEELGTIPGYSVQKATITMESSGDLATRRYHTVTVTYRYEPLFSWPGSQGTIAIRDVRRMVSYK